MKVKRLSALLLVPLLMGQGSPGTSFWLSGEGSVSCATWLSTPAEERTGAEWVFGFFSGRNYALNAMIGKDTDAAGLVGEVKLYCQNNPASNLATATNKTYVKMGGKN